jgi:hypothetical protein
MSVKLLADIRTLTAADPSRFRRLPSTDRSAGVCGSDRHVSTHRLIAGRPVGLGGETDSLQLALIQTRRWICRLRWSSYESYGSWLRTCPAFKLACRRLPDNCDVARVSCRRICRSEKEVQTTTQLCRLLSPAHHSLVSRLTPVRARQSSRTPRMVRSQEMDRALFSSERPRDAAGRVTVILS